SALGVSNLDALHQSALRGYAGGGLVGAARSATSAHKGTSAAQPTVNINAPVTVNGSAGTPTQNDDLARRMAKEMEATMRGTVADELKRQMRPGNMLNRRNN